MVWTPAIAECEGEWARESSRDFSPWLVSFDVCSLTSLSFNIWDIQKCTICIEFSNKSWTSLSLFWFHVGSCCYYWLCICPDKCYVLAFLESRSIGDHLIICRDKVTYVVYALTFSRSHLWDYNGYIVFCGVWKFDIHNVYPNLCCIYLQCKEIYIEKIKLFINLSRLSGSSSRANRLIMVLLYHYMRWQCL